MPLIVVKEIKTELFNVVEASDPDVFRRVFSSGGHVVHDIDLNEHIFDQVANDLGVQLRWAGEELHDFVTGGYHPRADALTGTQLGNVTEVISYLLWRSTGRKVTRVESYRRGDGKNEFPQPDFLIEEDGKIGALEIKSTQALNVHSLKEIVDSASKHRWKHLLPCSAVGPRRLEALRQLGYEEGTPRQQLHQLVLRDNREMPFPSDFGVVHVHLVRDGRLNELRMHQNARRLKTLPECAGKQRDCWNCLDAILANEKTGVLAAPAHISLVSMHNAPGSLGLLGGGENAVNWHKSYARWSQALWAADPVAVDVMQQNLVQSTDAWIEEVAAESSDAAAILRGMWDRYLGELATGRGLRELGGRPRFVARQVVDGFEPRARLSVDEPDVVILEQTPSEWINREEAGRLYIPSPEGGGPGGRGISLRMTSEALEVHSLSQWWWKDSSISAEQAVQVAQNLLAAAWNATRGPEGATFVIRGGLQEVRARIGLAEQDAVFLGWHFASSGDWRSITARFEDRRMKSSCPWLLALSFGDPRCKLIVHPDGRGYLRIDRALSVAQPTPISVGFDDGDT